MAIEKMKLLGIKGDSKILDEFLANVLFQSDVQIEDAKKIYNKGWKIEYFEYNYKIKETLKKCENLLNKIGIEYTKEYSMNLLENSIEHISSKIDKIEPSYEECLRIIENNEKENEEYKKAYKEISKLQEIDIDIKKIYDLEYVKFRYGSIPKKNLEEIKKQIDNINAIMFEISEDKDIVWIMYFTTEQYVGNIDGLFNIQKFERKLLPDDLLKTPREYLKALRDKISQRDFSTNEINQKIEKIKRTAETELLGYYRELQTYDKINTIKKYIVHDQNNIFYVVVWVPENELSKFENKLKQVEGIDYVIKDDENPPTKLVNNKIIKPFEYLVKMYGMPKKGELDPTWFVALTTFIMFGFMFGDVGHGMVFLLIRNNTVAKKTESLWSNSFCWRDFICYIWSIIWQCIWKRRYNKTSNNKSDEQYNYNACLWYSSWNNFYIFSNDFKCCKWY